MRFISLLFADNWLRDNGERIGEIFFRPMGKIPEEGFLHGIVAGQVREVSLAFPE